MVLGVLGFFRKFVHGYADIAKPIHDVITVAEKSSREAHRKLSAKQWAAAHGRLQVVWTPAAAAAVERLVDLLY